MLFTEGYVLDGRYLLKRSIGRGSFGEVWLAQDLSTEVDVAVKIYIDMDKLGLNEFKREFQVSFELNHTNLLRPNFLGISDKDQCPYLVMTFCPNGSASKLAGKITEEQMWIFIRDVASGLAFLHKQNPPIVHQDIKPDNILISKSGDFVITDFGISHKVRENMRKASQTLNKAGSMAYMGPEHFTKNYISLMASDIWSLGVTIYELACDRLPFCGMGGSMLTNGADYPELDSELFSADLNHTMQACLAKETWDRPKAKDLARYASKKVEGESPIFPWKIPTQPESEKVEQIDISIIADRKKTVLELVPTERTEMEESVEEHAVDDEEFVEPAPEPTVEPQEQLQDTITAEEEKTGVETETTEELETEEPVEKDSIEDQNHVSDTHQIEPSKSDSKHDSQGNKKKYQHKIKYKIFAIAFTAVLILIGGSLAIYFATKSTPEPEPRPEPIIIETLTYDKMIQSLQSNPNQGWEDLLRLSDEGDSDATFFLSRLYFKSKSSRDIEVDSIKYYRELVSVEIDNVKAHALLEKAISQNEGNYKALYELGCDYLGGHSRDESYERNLDMAFNLFKQAKDFASKAFDITYESMSKEKITKISNSK